MIRKFELTTGLVHGIFSGTYETLWEVNEYSDRGIEQYVDYDSKEMMATIAHAYHNHEAEILEAFREYGMTFVKSVVFNGGFDSPREYNFSTDKLYLDVEVDMDDFKTHFEILKDNEEFTEWLYENYKSRDGFWSFTPCTWEGLWEAYFGEDADHAEQAMGAVMSWYIEQSRKDSDYEYYDGIEYAVYEDWSGNGYGGLDYKILCSDCYKEVQYSDDFECQNKDCTAYTPEKLGVNA